MKNKKVLLIAIVFVAVVTIMALAVWGMNSQKADSSEQQKDSKPKVEKTCSFEVEEGEYEAPLTVVIQKVKNDDKIYYTTDGSDPTEASKLYEEPFVLEAGEYLVKAVTYNAKGEWGPVEEIKYTVNREEEAEALLINNLQGTWFAAQYNDDGTVMYETDFVFSNDSFELIERETVSGDSVRVYYSIASVNASGTKGVLTLLSQEAGGLVLEITE